MLEGLRVVEMATYIAAPSAGCMLADWGAEVIKIEPPGGDPIRNILKAMSGADVDENPVFDLDNRGKRSLCIDVKTPEGAEAIRRLIAKADVFITNVRPGALGRIGLDWASISEAHPRLIYGSVTGYGLEGEERDRPGFDLAAFWARSGLARLTVPKDMDPIPMRTAVGDHTTGIALAGGIVAALYEREKSGKGRLVETSLLRTGIYCLGSDMAVQLRFGRIASTRPRTQAINPINSFFKAGDGTWICVLTRHAEGDWRRLAKALGQPGLADDPRFANTKARKENATELTGILDGIFASAPLEHWAEKLDAEDLVWAPVQTPAQVAADPQAEAAGAFVETELAGGGTFRSVATPVRFHGDERHRFPPAPTPGEHNTQILSEIGYSPAEIAKLSAGGRIT
jgi:crotonobetainyl-CoA:carnitine CoA-transferase CaiB-like acyl-CoA transferase